MSKKEAKKLEEYKDPIIFYCKDCSEIVDTIRLGGKYIYKCKKCGTKNVAFGTPKSLRGYFRLDEKEAKQEREEIRRQKARGDKSADKL